MSFRAVQPMTWAGEVKIAGGPMVCGACGTPEACDAADRCARASDEDYLWPLLTNDERQAIAHVKERIRVDGEHNLTGCPRFCRAMCSYSREIKAMISSGRWPSDLA